MPRAATPDFADAVARQAQQPMFEPSAWVCRRSGTSLDDVQMSDLEDRRDATIRNNFLEMNSGESAEVRNAKDS